MRVCHYDLIFTTPNSTVPQHHAFYPPIDNTLAWMHRVVQISTSFVLARRCGQCWEMFWPGPPGPAGPATHVALLSRPTQTRKPSTRKAWVGTVLAATILYASVILSKPASTGSCGNSAMGSTLPSGLLTVTSKFIRRASATPTPSAAYYEGKKRKYWNL